MLKKLYHAWVRARDIDEFWPVCKRCSTSIEDARRFFLMHTDYHAAWQNLSREARVEKIRGLK